MGIRDLATELAQTALPLAGRLVHFAENWQVICKDPWVTNTISGYLIDLIRHPYQPHPPRELQFSTEGQEALREEIKSMLNKQAISEVSNPRDSFVSQMFLVPKKGGGQRPVINLKHLNSFVKTEHFKMENIQMLKDLLRAGDWMAKIDLKDAYFMVPIADEHKKLLRFPYRGSIYQFNCLPFGLSSAPWVFTKTTRPAVTTLRELGLRMIIYIDDMLLMAESEQMLRDQVTGLVYLMENLGFVINHKKSQVGPSQEIEFLGFLINSQTMELKLPGNKIKTIRSEARNLLASERLSAQVLSRVLGKMNAATQAIAMAPLFYRHLQTALREATRESQDYSTEITLPPEAKEELRWWVEHFTQWNGRSLLVHNPSMVIETDASDRGWGAVCNEIRTGGPWTPQEREMHINCREMLAASLAVKCFAKDKTSLHILLKMDSMSALSYINKRGGTISPELTYLAKQLWLWCMERDISLSADHLPGIWNAVADEESRTMRDRTDWKLNPHTFNRINQILGPLEIDLFATRLTHQLPQFVSWKPDPLAMMTDAFAMDWSKRKAYANPPWNLIGRVLAQCRRQQAELVLIAPTWKGQPWYPTLLEMVTRTPLLIQPAEDLIQPTDPINCPDVIPQLAVWNISGRDTEAANYRTKLQRSLWHHGDLSHPNHTTPCMGNGYAGVINGTPIPFQVL